MDDSSNKGETELPPLPGESHLRAMVYRRSRRNHRSPAVARAIAEAAVLKGRAVLHDLGVTPRSPLEDSSKPPRQ
jgi:hypothetical protein